MHIKAILVQLCEVSGEFENLDLTVFFPNDVIYVELL